MSVTEVVNGGQHIRVLMLEDSPRDAELTKRYLRREQLVFSLAVVDDEASFRSMLETTDPDVILADYNLPGFDGMRALEIACVLAPETPFLFLSGVMGEERAVEALRGGATDYVPKDRMQRLASAIVRALAERHERFLRQNMEKALRASEQRFVYAAAATREIIWDWDLVTSKIWFSDAFRDDWGYVTTETDVPADWFWQRIHPEERETMAASFHEAVARDERWRGEFRLSRADGSYGTVVARGMVVRDAAGSAVRVIGAIFDITERLQLQQQLEQARRIESLGRVAATVAHEFNNVLMGVLPLAEILRLTPNQAITEQVARRITDAVSRGRRLTEQILRFSKPADPAFTPVDLDQWLDQVIPEQRIIAGPNVTMTLSVRDAPLPVSIDPPQMQQVLSNLIVNARDAMPRGGTIRLLAETSGNYASLSVADEGTGMPPHVLQRIFEPLYTTKRSGTGLGLAVAQQIVVRHNGSIEVTSTAGEGTAFRIFLPLVQKP